MKRSGEIEDVVTNLTVPTGMTFGPDKALYVSNFGAAPAGTWPDPEDRYYAGLVNRAAGDCEPLDIRGARARTRVAT